MARGGKRTGAGRKRVLDDATTLRIGFDCEERHRAECRRRWDARFAERWGEYNAVAAQLPMSKRAGVFGPGMMPLTERAQQFLDDVDAELVAIAGEGRLASTEAELAAYTDESLTLTRPVPRRIIMVAAVHSILEDMDDAEPIPAPYGVRRKIIEAVWSKWRQHLPHLTKRRVVAAWTEARALDAKFVADRLAVTSLGIRLWRAGALRGLDWSRGR
jgi:hypothetical protein